MKDEHIAMRLIEETNEYLSELNLIKQDFRFSRNEESHIERLEYLAKELKESVSIMQKMIRTKR